MWLTGITHPLTVTNSKYSGTVSEWEDWARQCMKQLPRGNADAATPAHFLHWPSPGPRDYYWNVSHLVYSTVSGTGALLLVSLTAWSIHKAPSAHTGAFFSKAQKADSYLGLSVGLDTNAKRGDYTSFRGNPHQPQQDVQIEFVHGRSLS